MLKSLERLHPYLCNFTPTGSPVCWMNLSVNGSGVYSGTPGSAHDPFPGTGTYKVCMDVTSEKTKCSKCVNICMADNGKNPEPVILAAREEGAQTAVGVLRELHHDKVFPLVKDVSPNPSHTGWNVRFQATLKGNATISLYSLEGEKLQEKVTDLSEGSNTIFVDAKQLSTGTYLLLVTSEGNPTLQTKVIKN